MPSVALRFAVALMLGGAASLACGGGSGGGGPNPVPTSIGVTPGGPLTLSSGTTRQLAATVLDEDGKAMPGVSVTWQSDAATVAAVSSTGNVAAALVGAAGITAHAGTLVSNVVQVTVTPGTASRITATAGASQSGKVVNSAADTLVARVTDAAGNLISGAAVAWQLTSGTGTLTAPQTTTSAAGTTQNVLTLGTSLGTRVVRAALSGVATAAQYSIAAIAGPAVSLSVGSHAVVIDSGGSTGTLWVAQDAFGNPATLGNVTFTARGAGVTVASTGVVTARQRGNTIVVASLPAVATDSVDVLVAVPGAPALVTDLSNFGIAAGATVNLTLLLDMRASGERLGATTVQLTWDPALLAYQGDADAGNGLGAAVNADSATGTLLLAAASANGLSGPVALRTITFQAAPGAGVQGVLTLSTTEVRAALTFLNLLAGTVAASHPVITQ